MLPTLQMEHVRFFVRKVGDRWTFGSEKQPFVAFESKAKAIERGRAFVAKMEYATLVVDESTTARGAVPTAARSSLARRKARSAV